MATNIKNASKELVNKIIIDYQNGKSMRQLEKDYGITRTSISKFLEEKQIKTIKGNHYRKYYHNFNFFEKIDSEEKAYWLGFMYADGYILDNTNRYGEDQFGITLNAKDKKHLEKFKKSIEATNPINYDHSKFPYEQVKIVLTSQKTVNDLIYQGCFKKKTFILKPPKFVPEELILHFIRGFFDGDGSLTYTKVQNKYDVYGINITAIYEIAIWLQNYFGYGSIIQDRRRKNSWYFSFGGNRQVLKFCNAIYKDATVYLDRKYEKYLELKQKYSES